MKHTKALILAAGFGSRLMPLTQKKPKCMVSYKNRKIIDYEINALKAAGVKEIALVGGYLFEVLESYAKQNHDIKLFYKNPKFDSTNMVSTLFCAREFLENCVKNGNDLIISYADIVYFAPTAKLLFEAKGDFNIVVDKDWLKLWSKRFDNPLDDAESLKISNGFITELGKKPKDYSDIEAQYMGLFKFSAEFLPKVIAFYDGLDKNALYDGKGFENMYMTSFLQALIDGVQKAWAVQINGGWCEIDFKSDLEIEIDEN